MGFWVIELYAVYFISVVILWVNSNNRISVQQHLWYLYENNLHSVLKSPAALFFSLQNPRWLNCVNRHFCTFLSSSSLVVFIQQPLCP